MKSRKIAVNIFAIYLKIIFNTIVTLIATRLVLEQLGANDFGLYNLLAGIIMMLSFLNGSLLISTQRFMSVAIGEGQPNKLTSIFNASISIHTLLSVGLVVVLLILQPLFVGEILTIAPERVLTAHVVYDIMIFSAVFTLLQVPFSATMYAHEDIYAWAITEALNSLLRFVAAILLMYFDSNKLEWYTIFMFVALFVSFGAKFIWCRIKYSEIRFVAKELFNKQLIKKMIGFVGWNSLGSASILIRDQGVAMLINVFYGTIANAAYGIANQVNGLAQTFATTITNVFAPSIMKLYGAGNIKKMMRTATLSSKVSFFISSLSSIPLILLAPQILDIWLKETPNYTEEFCKLTIISSVVMQFTAGFNRAIYATGNIKWYQISLMIILSAIIPIGYILLRLGYPPDAVLYCTIAGQVATSIATVYFCFKAIKYNPWGVLSLFVVAATVIFAATMILTDKILFVIGAKTGLAVLAVLLSMVIYSTIYFFVVFDNREKQEIKCIVFKNRRN